jgi:hypothetical protein
VTVNVAEPVCPPESVALHVTVAVPIEKTEPDASEQSTVESPSTASWTEAGGYETAVPAGFSV